MQTPAKVHLLVPVQFASVVTVQLPTVAQQEPVCGGWVHGFGSQTPARVHMLVPVQAVLVVTVQVPSGAQQEPGCGHGFGAQMPAWVQFPVQFT
jgi:hypothetical protein